MYFDDPFEITSSWAETVYPDDESVDYSNDDYLDDDAFSHGRSRNIPNTSDPNPVNFNTVEALWTSWSKSKSPLVKLRAEATQPLMKFLKEMVSTHAFPKDVARDAHSVASKKEMDYYFRDEKAAEAINTKKNATNKKRQCPALPVEVWDMILDYRIGREPNSPFPQILNHHVRLRFVNRLFNRLMVKKLYLSFTLKDNPYHFALLMMELLVEKKMGTTNRKIKEVILYPTDMNLRLWEFAMEFALFQEVDKMSVVGETGTEWMGTDFSGMVLPPLISLTISDIFMSNKTVPDSWGKQSKGLKDLEIDYMNAGGFDLSKKRTFFKSLPLLQRLQESFTQLGFAEAIRITKSSKELRRMSLGVLQNDAGLRDLFAQVSHNHPLLEHLEIEAEVQEHEDYYDDEAFEEETPVSVPSITVQNMSCMRSLNTIRFVSLHIDEHFLDILPSMMPNLKVLVLQSCTFTPSTSTLHSSLHPGPTNVANSVVKPDMSVKIKCCKFNPLCISSLLRKLGSRIHTLWLGADNYDEEDQKGMCAMVANPAFEFFSHLPQLKMFIEDITNCPGRLYLDLIRGVLSLECLDTLIHPRQMEFLGLILDGLPDLRALKFGDVDHQFSSTHEKIFKTLDQLEMVFMEDDGPRNNKNVQKFMKSHRKATGLELRWESFHRYLPEELRMGEY